MTTSTWIVISLILIVLYYIGHRIINKLENEKITLLIGIVWFIFTFSSGFVVGRTIGMVFLDSITTSEVECKQYLIDHSDDIRLINDNDIEFNSNYKVDTCLLPYWDDITIKDYKDSVYVLFWGDRDSWKWRFNKDNGFWICRSDSLNDNLDVKIFNILDKLTPIIFPEPIGYINDFEGPREIILKTNFHKKFHHVFIKKGDGAANQSNPLFLCPDKEL